MTARRWAAVAALTLSSLLTAPTASAVVGSEATVQAQPAYSCSINASAKVEADWLRVHTSPSVGSASPGQLPGGATFHYCTSSGRWNPKYSHYWYYGWGYHGKTRLTGWVDAQYLNYGP